MDMNFSPYITLTRLVTSGGKHKCKVIAETNYITTGNNSDCAIIWFNNAEGERYKLEVNKDIIERIYESMHSK